MADGRQAAVCMGPTVMQQMVRYCLTRALSRQYSRRGQGFRNELIAKRARLAPTQIGSDGRIMEWLEQYQEPEPTIVTCRIFGVCIPAKKFLRPRPGSGAGRPQNL